MLLRPPHFSCFACVLLDAPLRVRVQSKPLHIRRCGSLICSRGAAFFPVWLADLQHHLQQFPVGSKAGEQDTVQ
nr:unnamed protein product [Digitaria exilis]